LKTANNLFIIAVKDCTAHELRCKAWKTFGNEFVGRKLQLLVLQRRAARIYSVNNPIMDDIVRREDVREMLKEEAACIARAWFLVEERISWIVCLL
jgi:hypothetical protein